MKPRPFFPLFLIPLMYGVCVTAPRLMPQPTPPTVSTLSTESTTAPIEDVLRLLIKERPLKRKVWEYDTFTAGAGTNRVLHLATTYRGPKLKGVAFWWSTNATGTWQRLFAIDDPAMRYQWAIAPHATNGVSVPTGATRDVWGTVALTTNAPDGTPKLALPSVFIRVVTFPRATVAEPPK